MREVYIVAMQGPHGPEPMSSNCAFIKYENAQVEVKKYHADGLTWMKVFTLNIMDAEEQNNVG